MYNPKPLLMLISRAQPPLLLLPKQIKQTPSCLDCLFCVSELTKNKKGRYVTAFKCTRFTKKDNTYYDIFKCRNDENKCGKSAKLFLPIDACY
jgi:hypothetical protein